MLHFYTSWKRQKTFAFLMFSGGVEIKHFTKMGQIFRIVTFTNTSFLTYPHLVGFPMHTSLLFLKYVSKIRDKEPLNKKKQ